MQTPSAPPVTLRQLLAALPDGGRVEPPGADVAVSDVTHDSRAAGGGVLFACRPGRLADGHAFAPDAVAAGSPALLVERVLDLPVPQLVVTSVAAALGPVSAAVHGAPSTRMLLLGVTGTNGKTTTTYLLESILRAAGHRTGLVGTVETLIAGHAVGGVRTTPEAPDLQRLFRRMLEAGVSAAAMEVSSHGLALGRVAGTRFAGAVFTNLTQDHLDFHRDIEDYFEAKASLFSPRYTALGVVNIDDPYGARLAQDATVAVVTFSPSGERRADVSAGDIRLRADGSRFTARLRGRAVEVHVPLPGRFNVANTLGALALAEAVGVDLGAATAGVAAVRGVPGRMEPVDVGQPFTVLVDYAHTPDSLEHVLRAARDLTGGRVLVVFGCGGDRDRGKRPAMGATAAALADLAVVTSDNPRSEDPEAIIDAVVAGARDVAGARVLVEVDRRAAIAAAVDEADAGDVVVIAGKGHETSQQFAHETVAFDDREVARAALAARYPTP